MRKGVRKTLRDLSASLFAATFPAATDQVLAQPYYGYEDAGRNDNFGPGFAYSELNSALLVYQESAGRVSAVEPALDLSVHAADGRELDLGLVADAVSGATPNGAVPSNAPQNFVTPIRAQGSTATVTSASGGSTIIQLPPTPGQISAAALGRQYTVPANTLPTDKGFHDHRGSANFGWSQPIDDLTQWGIGGGYSRETDYQALTANIRLSRAFNANNTTVSLSLNTELDSSFPFGGIPTPLTVMNAQWKTPTSRDKTQSGFVFGLTQALSRRWLMQLNYAFDRQDGYQNDPYRIISLVDSSSGVPIQSLYENRPLKRQSQSFFWDNKFDFAFSVTDVSLRYYADSWGVKSNTAEISERLALLKDLYFEPGYRWYHQTAASFFHYYLAQGQSLPAYATSDSRLAQFTGTTLEAKLGWIVSKRSELYIKAEYYRQAGNGHPADAIGQLKQQNLFPSTAATMAFVGYTWDFH
jgi:hypothetical protein